MNRSLVFVWNENGEIVYYSNDFKQYLADSKIEIMGKQWTTLFPSHIIAGLSAQLIQSDNQIIVESIYLEHTVRKDEFQALFEKIMINKEQLYICKLINLTYEDDLKRTLADSEKLVLAGQLSAGLIHEIKNPLTSLKGFLQLVQAGVQQKEEYFKVMINEIDKLEKISSELLHLSKPIKGVKNQEYLHHLVQDVVFILSTQLDMRNMKFVIDIDDDLICSCDATQIKQVLLNLIKNGAESMHKEGTIKVKSKDMKDYVGIAVIDQGPGLKAAEIRELQTPFYTTKQEGTGLGLIIVNYLLNMHQGFLDIRANKSGGTTFTIMLPRNVNN